jgi:hypothetical protein
MSRKRSGKRGPGKESSEAAPEPSRGPSRRRWILRLAALLVAGLAALLWATQQVPGKVVYVQNKSGGPITSLRVTVAGKTTAVREVPPGATVPAPYGDDAEAKLVIDGDLPGGKLHFLGTAKEGYTAVVEPGGQINKYQPPGR